VTTKRSTNSTNQIQGRLLLLAALFLSLYSLSLTLSPAVRNRTWEVPYRWEHWFGFGTWLIIFIIIHRYTSRYLNYRDPFLVPIIAILTGWGMLSIWRLYPAFGIRQTAWLIVASIIFLLGLRLKSELLFLRQYKYIWLTAGLILMGLTLIFGTNPTGIGPKLWLGCCGIYLQPSEPLKLLLIIYLSAYFAEYQHILIFGPSARARIISQPFISLLTPTLVMTGLALLLLVIQRDLGTTSIFILIYTVIVYIATKKPSILLIGALTMTMAGFIGYIFFDVVRLRIEAWLNPWLDPSGRSYQIVQSLIAVANGGVIGRGSGLGNPTLVPISHSDFIFSAVVEESGLFGAIGIITILAFLTVRGLIIAFYAPDRFRRYIAAGITIYLVAQSILIIGGNLRLFPLTGVTLPFLSYGGSSLVTSFIAVLILLHISNSAQAHPINIPNLEPYTLLGGFLLCGLAGIALVTGWWSYYRSNTLLERTDNARRSIADRYVQRGAILDRHNDILATSTGAPGEFKREIYYPELGPVIGYTHPVYGQSGLEASLDPYLRGLRGNPGLTIWWNHLVYGQPPPGLDVRISIDHDLQSTADLLLADNSGALVLLNAQSGEILAMASHPTFDPNLLDQTWPDLIEDPNTPLFNRATLGRYSPGASLGALLMAAATEEQELPKPPSHNDYQTAGQTFSCTKERTDSTWEDLIINGCPRSQIELAQSLGAEKVLDFYQKIGLYSAPEVRLPTDSINPQKEFNNQELAFLGIQEISVNPLQMVLAAATLSNGGILPSPRLATAVDIPSSGWITLPALAEPLRVFSSDTADQVSQMLKSDQLPIWQTTAVVPNQTGNDLTWYLAGTLPGWGGTPLSLVILLETDDPAVAELIGQSLMETTIGN